LHENLTNTICPDSNEHARTFYHLKEMQSRNKWDTLPLFAYTILLKTEHLQATFDERAYSQNILYIKQYG